MILEFCAAGKKVTTLSDQAIEFRCQRCWQLTYAPVEDAGESTACLCCGDAIVVPAATPERLRPASVLQPVADEMAVGAATVMPDENTSDAELERIVRSENNVSFSERDFSGYMNASLLSRFVAWIIDTAFLAVAVALSFLAALAAGRMGLVDFDLSRDTPDLSILLIVNFIPLLALIVQWNLIATRGQTIGKFLTGIRIVCMNGQVPGFILGVVVRNWVRNLLSMIPFFGLLDILTALGSSQRCIHDFLAGTRVIQG